MHPSIQLLQPSFQTPHLPLLPNPKCKPKTLKPLPLHAHSSPSPTQPLTTTRNNHNQFSSRIQLHFHTKYHKNCIHSYHQALAEGLAPSRAALALVAKSCAALGDLRTLRIAHNDAVRLKMELDGSLGAAIVDGYVKCGCMDMAHQVFERMPHRDVVAWTVVMSGFCRHGLLDKAVECFRAMVAEGIALDDVALVNVLSAAAGSACLKHGAEVHGYLIRRGFELSKALMTSLVNMYVKLGRIARADRIVSHADEENVAAWTAVMMGHASSNDMRAALLVYEKMVNLGIEPTKKTINCVLSATSRLHLLHVGAQIHGYILKGQVELDNHLLSSLIDMYSTCGAPASLCRQLFDQLLVKDVVSFTMMIRAYSQCMEGHAALRLFDEMQLAGVHPDSIAFTAVLSACASCGLLQEGLQLYSLMVQDWGIKPTHQHFACLRNLITKDRRIEETYEAIQHMPIKDDRVIWEAFFGACRVHRNVGFSKLAARKLLEINGVDSSAALSMLADGIAVTD